MSERWAAFFARIRDAAWFRHGVIGVILAAGVVIGLETYPAVMARFGGLLKALDTIILAIFVIEIVIKILAEGKRPWRFFASGWNLFDFTIVAVALLPLQAEYVAVLRLVRLLRVLRLVSAVPRLQFLVNVLLKAIPSMGYVGLLLLLIFYIYAVLGVFLFGGNDPVHFRDLQTAVLTLFRVVTLEDWTDIMYIQMKGSDVYRTGLEHWPDETFQPQAWGYWAVLYFVSFVLCGSLVILNLFIGVIVNGIHEIHTDDERRKATAAGAPTAEDSLRVIEQELERLRALLPRDEDRGK